MLCLTLKDTQGPLHHLAFPRSRSSTCLTLVSMTATYSAPYREEDWGGSLQSPFQNLRLGQSVDVNNQTTVNEELKKWEIGIHRELKVPFQQCLSPDGGSDLGPMFVTLVTMENFVCDKDVWIVGSVCLVVSILWRKFWSLFTHKRKRDKSTGSTSLYSQVIHMLCYPHTYIRQRVYCMRV